MRKFLRIAAASALAIGVASLATPAAAGASAERLLEAAKYRRLQQSSDDGTVRADGLANALAERARMIRARPKAAGISSGNWTGLGPDNIGGRIRSILTHPTDPNWLMVGSVSGGLWHSTDAGASWHPVDDLMPNVAIESLARDPGNPSRIYAGTGEGITGVTPGLGIFVSDDGGVTWRQMPGTNPTDPGKADFTYVERIAVHATNGNIVVMASGGSGGGGVWRTLNALSAAPVWEKICGAGGGYTSVAFDPHSPNRVLAGNAIGIVCVIGDVTTAGAAPSYTARELTISFGGRVELAFARATPGLVLASVNAGSGSIYYSTNSGDSWTFNSNPQHLGDQGWYDNAIWVDPTNSRRALIGGEDIYRLDGPDGWWTTNTPLTATRMSAFTGGSAHPDQHVIVEALGYDGTTKLSVYFGNDGGIYRRDDITSDPGGFWNLGWTNLNNGLAISQFYHGAGKAFPTGVTRILGGTQDNGTLVAPQSGRTWTPFLGGDGGAVAVDPGDADRWYAEDVYASVFRKVKANESNPNICHGILEANGPLCGGNQRTLFISPFILDPNDPATMLVGSFSLWRGRDVRTSNPPVWASIKPGASGDISALAVATGNSDLVWTGDTQGEVYCTTNGTAASPVWTRVQVPAFRMVTSITVDPANANRMFITYGGFNGSNVWELTHPSQVCTPAPTMTDRHGNLPLAPVFSVARHPLNANLLYAGTEIGVFASTDGGASWSPTNDGASTVSVRQLFWIDDTTLVAATFGRGMFKTSVIPGTLQFSQSTASIPETAGSISLTVTRSGGTAGATSVAYATADGSASAGVNYTATQGTLSWADGDASAKTIFVPILDDHAAAGDKTFGVTLSNPSNGAALGGAAAVTVTIVDSASVLPGAPTIGSATVGDASITVTFSPPASPGGSAITSYTATCSAAALPDASATGSGSPLTVTNVSAGSTYTCTVRATNAAGTGPASAPSNAVVPKHAQAIAFTSTPPAPATVGGTYLVSATASSGGAVAFAIAPASSGVCSISGTTVAFLAPGDCTIEADQPGDATHYAAPTAMQAFTIVAAIDPARLGNIATRVDVLTGDNVVIGGFVIGGSTTKTVVVRARGPSLAAFGIANPLANPTLMLVRSSDQAIIASNDNWADAANASQVSASGFAPGDSLESAIMITLAPGAYTAIVAGANGGTGVGIVEVFEVDHVENPLVNIATRGLVQTGDDVMIGGFVIQGSAPQTVVVRARGPSLAAFGIANPLANPTLTLVRSSDQSIVVTNDDWQNGPSATQISAAGLAPGDPRESAVMATLPPGAYTAIVSGVGNTTGVGIVEVFATQ